MPGTAMGPSKDCTTPWETSRRAMTVETGTKKYNVLRVRSVQKFPRVEAHLLSSPRIRADMTAIPVPALTVSYAVTDWLAVGAETQVKVEHQDFEAYYSAFVRLEWSPLENVTVVPMVRYGYNGGYNVDYDDGSNCIDWSLGVTWRFAEHYTLSGSVNYSQAATVLRHRDAGDEFWVGFRLGVEF